MLERSAISHRAAQKDAYHVTATVASSRAESALAPQDCYVA